MVIPSLTGVIIWKDEFRRTVGIGIGLFLAAFSFIGVPACSVLVLKKKINRYGGFRLALGVAGLLEVNL